MKQGRKTGRPRSGNGGGWLWKGVLIGATAGVGCCALLAALLQGGILPEALGPAAGQAAAGCAALAAGIAGGALAREQRLARSAVCCAVLAAAMLLGNLLFVGQLRLPAGWLCGTAGGAGWTMLRMTRPKRRAYRRK